MALGSFYEGDALEVEDLDAARPLPNQDAAAASKPEESKPSPTNKPAARGQTGASNISSFASRFGASSGGANKDDDSSSEEEGQAFYAGGSETSGQQILGPGKKKEGSDFVKHMFKKAKEHGAEAVESSGIHGAAGASSSRQAFGGSGFRLGSTGNMKIF